MQTAGRCSVSLFHCLKCGDQFDLCCFFRCRVFPETILSMSRENRFRQARANLHLRLTCTFHRWYTSRSAGEAQRRTQTKALSRGHSSSLAAALNEVLIFGYASNVQAVGPVGENTDPQLAVSLTALSGLKVNAVTSMIGIGQGESEISLDLAEVILPA